MATDPIKIGTWNIAATQRFDALMDVLDDLGVHACAVQEYATDASELARASEHIRSGQKYKTYFSPSMATLNPAFSPSRQFGLAFLVRQDVECRSVQSFRLTPHQLTPDFTAETEPRTVQFCTIGSLFPLIIANTHLAHTPDWRASPNREAQAQDIASIFSRIEPGARALLCGDFNAEVTSTDLRPLTESLANRYVPDDWTYTGTNGPKIIDYFLSRSVLDAHVSVHDTSHLSDHNLAVLTIEAR